MTAVCYGIDLVLSLLVSPLRKKLNETRLYKKEFVVEGCMENKINGLMFSVAVITYNQEKYIAQTLDSIINQRHNYS